MTGPGSLDDLTTQLRDFMELAPDLDLPKVHHVKLERKEGEPGWHARAQLASYYGQTAWVALHAWHTATGAPVHVSEPHQSRGAKPWRNVAVTVSVAGLVVEVWGHVDADDPIPAWAQPEAQPALVNGTYAAEPGSVA